MKDVKITVMELNRKLAGLPRKPQIRRPDPGAELAPGLLWSLAGEPEARLANGVPAPSFLLLLTEDVGEGLFNAVPVFRWGELGGPACVYLPESLFGIGLVANLSIEATVDRNMLAECHGRLPEMAVEYVLEALALRQDPAARQAFTWGPGYLGTEDLRQSYAHSIAQRLEALQSSVRRQVFGATGQGSIPFDWEPVLASGHAYWRHMPQLAAADTGDLDTPCLLCDAPEPDKRMVKERQPAFLRAHVLAFDPISADREAEICCEWRLAPQGTPPLAAEAAIEDGRTGTLVGRASVVFHHEGWLITLNNEGLVADPPPIKSAAQLRILLLRAAETEA